MEGFPLTLDAVCEDELQQPFCGRDEIVLKTEQSEYIIELRSSMMALSP